MILSSLVKWGILSAGKISSDYAKALKITDSTEAIAVAARSLESAEKFARNHEIPKAYGSYDELINDPLVDVIYIGSIANQHFDLAKKCILAGKPIVCEKPMTLNYKDCLEVINLAREKNVFFMEGIWTRCFPIMKQVKELIDSDAIGTVKIVQSDFGWSTSLCDEEEDRIWDKESGGMILDIGMYMVQLGQVAFGSDCEVDSIQAMGSIKNDVDHTVLTSIMYRNTSTSTKGFLQFYVTGEANTEERVVIQGTKGRIVLGPPSHVPSQFTIELDTGRGFSNSKSYQSPLPNDSYTTWNYPGSIGFTYQIQDVNDALRRDLKECPSFTHKDSLQLAMILHEILSQVRNQVG